MTPPLPGNRRTKFEGVENLTMASILSMVSYRTVISVIERFLTLVHGLISTAKKKEEQKRVQKIHEDAVAVFLDTFNPHSSKSKEH